jgi:hypothetical protein
MKIIDFHTHAFSEKIADSAIEQLENHYQFEISNSGTVDNLIEKVEEADLHKAVVHNAAVVPEQVKVVNDCLLAIENEKLVTFGTIHPDLDNCEDELERIKSSGVKGLKLHPDFQRFDIISKDAYDMYKAIGDDFLVLFHVGDEVKKRGENYSTPRKLAQVISDFPELKVIAAHLGGYQMWEEAKDYLLGKDIYIDTSSALDFLPSTEAVNIIKTHGADRVLFGSDFPIKDPAVEIRKLGALGLDLIDRVQILSKNGLKLLAELGVK